MYFGQSILNTLSKVFSPSLNRALTNSAVTHSEEHFPSSFGRSPASQAVTAHVEWRTTVSKDQSRDHTFASSRGPSICQSGAAASACA